MSFAFGLSDDEEEPDEALEWRGIGRIFSQQSNENDEEEEEEKKESLYETKQKDSGWGDGVFGTASASAGLDHDEQEEEEDDWDEDGEDGDDGYFSGSDMEWEDGENHEQQEQQQQNQTSKHEQALNHLEEMNQKMPANSAKESTEEKKQPPKKKRRVNTRILRNAPPEVQQLALELHQSHLLSLMAHTCFVSKSCANPELLAQALSLIPSHFLLEHTESRPTLKRLLVVAQWFFAWVNQVHERRRAVALRNRAQGAPRRANTNTPRSNRAHPTDSNEQIDMMNMPMQALHTQLQHAMTYLSPPNDDNPDYYTCYYHHAHNHTIKPLLLSPSSKTQLLLIMCRALGWRVRYVSCWRKIMSRELTVDHALFQLWEDQVANNKKKSRKKKRRKYNQEEEEFLHKVFGHLSRTQANDGSKDVSEDCKLPAKVTKKGKTSQQDKPVSKQTSPTKSPKRQQKKSPKGKSPENKKTIQKNDNHDQDEEDDPLEQHVYSWVEVLCRVPTTTTTKTSTKTNPPTNTKLQWIHVDPHHELLQKPLAMEQVMHTHDQTVLKRQNRVLVQHGRKKGQGRNFRGCQLAPHRASRNDTRNIGGGGEKKGRTRGRRPVSHVLAAEHHYAPSSQDHNKNWQEYKVRVTDVTPRYANQWAQTLKLRGYTGREVAQWHAKTKTKAKTSQNRNGNGNVDAWWEETLHCITNGTDGEKKKRCVDSKHERGGNTKEDAIQVPSSSDEDEDEHYDTLKRKLSKYPQDEDEEEDAQEAQELHQATTHQQTIPTSLQAFQHHPVYALASQLNSKQVLHPQAATRVCGLFRGECIYKRADVSEAMPAHKWLYQGRKVIPKELNKPAKWVKARKKRGAGSTSGGGGGRFRGLTSYVASPEKTNDPTQLEEDDEHAGMQRLYGHWQTHPWSPPRIGPQDPLPINSHRNIELALLNPGLVHMTEHRLSLVAKKLGIPYAPCLLGFDHTKAGGGQATPTIRGIVVHEHNVTLLREAHAMYESCALEEEFAKKKREVYGRWRKLIVGVLTKARLDEEYG